MMLGRVVADAAQKLADAGVELPERTAHWLWQHASGMSSHTMLIALRQEVDRDIERRFASLVTRRVAREPLQYIIGETEFCGLTLKVDSRALIPRPETEILVGAAIAQVVQRIGRTEAAVRREQPLRLCDVGTGSGAIAIAVAHGLCERGVHTGWRLVGIDSSASALDLAVENAERCGVSSYIDFQHGDLLATVPEVSQIDVLLANLPYIKSADVHEMQPEVAQYEPASALFAGADGLTAYRRLVSCCVEQHALAPMAWMIWEIGQGQSDAVLALLKATFPHLHISLLPDAQGIERFVVGTFASLLD